MCSVTLTSPSRFTGVEDLYPLAGEGESQEETNVGVGYKVVPPATSEEDVVVGLEAKQCSAVFVRDTDVYSLLVEEMFPVSSNLVPEEEKLRLHEVLSTYAGALGFRYCKGRRTHHRHSLCQANPGTAAKSSLSQKAGNAQPSG